MPTHDIVRSKTVRGQAKKDSAPIYVDQDDNKLKFIPAGSGTTEIELVDISSVQTLTNKTIVGGGSGSDPGSFTLGLSMGSSGSQNSVYDLGGQSIGDFIDFRTEFTDPSKDFTLGAAWFLTFNPSGPLSGNGEVYALNMEMRSKIGNNQNISFLSAIDATAWHRGDGTVADLIGITGNATNGDNMDSSHGGPVTLARALRGKVVNYSTSELSQGRGCENSVELAGPGDLVLGYAAWSQARVSGAGTMQWGVCYYAATPTVSTGTLVRSIGIYLAEQTVAGVGVNYQIYSPGVAPSYLAGDIGVGTSGPSAYYPAGFAAGRILSIYDTSNDAALHVGDTSSAHGIDVWHDKSAEAAYIDSINSAGTLTFRTQTNATPITALVINANGSISSARITPRIVTATANLTAITPTFDTADVYVEITNVGSGTFTINNPSGTPTDGQPFLIRIKATNSQTLAWDTLYRGSNDLALPVGLSGSSLWDYFSIRYNASSTKYDVVAANRGF